MVEAACIEVAKTDTLQQAEVLARRVARRVFHLIQPLTETSFPGQEAIDEADALLMDLDRTDGSWMGDGARPPMEEFLARIAERLTEASLALGAAETDGNDPVAAAPSPVREMVKAGQVSATRAAKAARKHGDKATAVLGEQLQQAQAQGKKRITAATTDKPKPCASDLQQERARLDFLVQGCAVVRGGGEGGFWLEWPEVAKVQEGAFDTPRAAIDAAIQAQEASQ